MSIDVEAFRAWLTATGAKSGEPYQPSTVRAVCTTAAHLARAVPESWARNPQTKQTIERLLAWHDDCEAVPFEHAFYDALRAAREGRWRVRRVQPERSIDDVRWASFGDALAARRGPEARVIELMVATGMRIGDALRVRREPVLEALGNTEGLIDLTVKGGKHAVRAVAGAPQEWAAIGALFRSAKDASNVAELVTPGQPEATGGPAYMRVRTELRAVGKIAGIEGRVHLHRVRRTVAVKALRHTKDIVLVAKLLDHGSITTTMKYVDEGRADEVAQLQRELAEKRKK